MMDRKRRNTSSPESDADFPLPSSKKLRRSNEDVEQDEFENYEPEDGLAEHPRTDNSFGMKGAFPGLGSVDDDELFYGPANDGIEYLRMVR